MRTPSLAAAALLPVLAATLAAQTPDHLVGLTRNAPTLRHVDHNNCQNLAQCVVPMPGGGALPPWAGGTAWDPVKSGTWVTNGTVIAMVSDGCNVICPPQPIPMLGPNAVVTGLEHVARFDEVWMIDSVGNLMRFADACPLMPLSVCNTGLVPVAVQKVTTGLAVDERNGLVFYAYCDFATGMNEIVVALASNPCVPISQFPVPPCGPAFGTVRGIACDWGNEILYLTDGFSTEALHYAWVGPNVNVLTVQCCNLPGAALDPMVGLTIRPGRATSVGVPCANGTCAPCPMVHTLRNDPVAGNLAFGLGLDQAQAGSFAWCLIGAGPCAAPGVTVLPFCGPIYTIPYLGAIGGNPTGGFAICDGSTTFSLPIPSVAALCGQVYSSQCVGLCFGGGAFGFSMSNCLSWQVQGN